MERMRLRRSTLRKAYGFPVIFEKRVCEATPLTLRRSLMKVAGYCGKAEPYRTVLRQSRGAFAGRNTADAKMSGNEFVSTL